MPSPFFVAKGRRKLNNVFSFFAYAALIVTVMLLLFFGLEISATSNAVQTASQIGAHVSALSGGNMMQVDQAVFSTLQQDGLVTTYNGQNLVTVTSSTSPTTSGTIVSITVAYLMPTLVTQVGSLVGDPNGLLGAYTLQSTESYANDTFFGG